MSTILEMSGYVKAPDDISASDFCDAFLDFIEEKGWLYFGSMHAHQERDSSEKSD